MEVVNLRYWYSSQQTMDLLGFKYYVQLHRWRKDNEIDYTKLCGIVLYLRKSVSLYLQNRPGMKVHRFKNGQITSVINYSKLTELKQRLMSVPAYDINLSEWQPQCMLEDSPHKVYLSRIINNQNFLPQVRHKTAYGLRFYNVNDIKREFK